MARLKIKRGRRVKVRGQRNVEADPADLSWLIRVGMKSSAMKVINDYKERPYWLSVPKNGAAKPSGFLPCSSFETKTRVYYGFLFREHRDMLFDRWDDARKELTGKDGPLRD